MQRLRLGRHCTLGAKLVHGLWISRFSFSSHTLDFRRPLESNWLQDRPPFRSMGACLIILVGLLTGACLWERQISHDPAFSILPPDDYLLYESEARGLVERGF